MNERTLHILDYFRMRDIVADCCMSEEGAQVLKQRLPLIEKTQIEHLKTLSAEWKILIESGKPAITQGWPPCKEIFPLLQVEGSVLDIEDFFALYLFCNSVSQIHSIIKNASSDLSIPLLTQEIEYIPQLESAGIAISRVIDASGQLKDLPELRAIRESINRIRRDIDNLVKHYTGDDSLRSALQSDVPALKNGRQVIAIKAGFRGRIKGIVHEVSRTGQTVYLEPDDVVHRNNDLIQEEHNLAQEIQKILRQLTATLRPLYDDFIQAHEKMIFLDGIYAAARWGVRTFGVFAKEGAFKLIKARHPVLGSQAVPINLELLPDCRVLIITGPNTGGKTVSLKTAALFALLNQSGFPIPAEESTTLPLFDAVFADIGDEQSLDQSLSTFSGHMKNIASMIDFATENSLILLDELGSGTDPLEGGAIAMAVLDFLLEKKSLVFATTHHGALKNYGYTHESCVNASVDFDSHTLSPTYRILMGIPGESHALDIARRSGLAKDLVDKAQTYLINEQADVSALIKGLTEKHEQMIQFEYERKKEQQYLLEQRRKTDLKELRLKQKELELREQGYRSSARFLDESRSLLENLVRELREGEITRDKTLKVKEVLAGLTQEVHQEQENLNKAQEELELLKASANEEYSLYDEHKENISVDENSDKNSFIVGAEVQLSGAGKQRGILIREERNGNWLVAVGNLKLTVKEKDMRVIHSSQSKNSLSIDISASSGGEIARFELNIRGMRFEEAQKALERQLDLAAMNGLYEFSIIHGKGNGILQQGVRDFLKKYPGVCEFFFARPEDGGSGKTIVKLKS